MFFLIGLGLGDAEDITVKGLDIVRRANKVYLEAYTSILTVGVDKLVCKTSKDHLLIDHKYIIIKYHDSNFVKIIAQFTRCNFPAARILPV